MSISVRSDSGSRGLILLTLLMLLFGGGFAPPTFMLPAMIILIIIAIAAGIFGYPLLWIFDADTSVQFLRVYGLIITFAAGPLVILAALAHDEQRRSL